MKKIIKHLKARTLLKAISIKIQQILFSKNKNAWQLNRNIYKKYDLISNVLKEKKICSILDVGCNAGIITRLAGNAGYFAVGIDKKLDFRGVQNPLDKACFGQLELNMDMINKLPKFDAVLLLSVHHQLICSYGDKWTQQFVYKLATKSNELFLIEFSALNKKYGKGDNEIFIDNDENSVIKYSKSWLNTALPNFTCEYIGKSPNDTREPFRFLFICVYVK